MKERIDSLIEKIGDEKISYSIGLYSLAVLLDKNIVTEEELVNSIKEVESQIKEEYLTENKSNKQLRELKKELGKIVREHSIKKIECEYVEKVDECYLGIVFDNGTCVTLKAYEDIEKIKQEAEKIIFNK